MHSKPFQGALKRKGKRKNKEEPGVRSHQRIIEVVCYTRGTSPCVANDLAAAGTLRSPSRGRRDARTHTHTHAHTHTPHKHSELPYTGAT